MSRQSTFPPTHIPSTSRQLSIDNPTSSRPTYCSEITGGPDSLFHPILTSLSKPNPIVFPRLAEKGKTRGDSTDTYDSANSKRSNASTRSQGSTSQYSYRPDQLRKEMLLSENANDHLRRIHITSCRYCERQDNKQQFIMFTVVDSAMPKVSNLLILDRNGRHSRGDTDSSTWRHATRAWAFKLLPTTFFRSCVKLPALRPGRFYISDVEEEQNFLNQTGIGSCNVLKTYDPPADQALSFDHILVLASSLASPRRFRHLHSMQSSDWYPQSMWEAIELVSEYIQKEEPLPAPLQLRNSKMDTSLLEKVLARYGENLRKYRSQVVRRQQVSKSCS